MPVLWGSTPLACEGEGRFATLVLATPAGEARIAADACALNLGFQPETGLARALGAAHRFVDDGLGRLETVTDEDGRTSLPGGLRHRRRRGDRRRPRRRSRAAGWPGWRRRATSASPRRTTRRRGRRCARALDFQAALWRIFAAPPFDIAAIADGTILCRCEEVTAGSLRRAQAEGAASLGRAEEGDARRHGPLPGAAVRRDARAALTGATDEAGFAAPRAPVKPVPAAALMLELPEFEAAAARPSPRPTATPRTAAAGTPPTGCCDVLVIGGGVARPRPPRCTWRARAPTCWWSSAARPAWRASTANAGSLHVQLLTYDFDGETPDRGPAIDTPAARPAQHRAVAGDRAPRPARTWASAPRAG